MPTPLHAGHTYLRVTTATPSSVSPTLPAGLALAYRGPIGELENEHVFEVTPAAVPRSVPGSDDPNANTVSYARAYGNAYQDSAPNTTTSTTTTSSTRTQADGSSQALAPDGPGWAKAKDGVVAAVRGAEGVKGVEVLEHRQRAKRTEF